jgi:mRNA interferase HicA
MAAPSKRVKAVTLIVRRNGRTSVLPMHGGSKQLGKGLWLKILKDLGLREN